MPVRKNITFITCTHTSGYTRLKVTTQPTSIVRRRGRVIHSQPRLHTAAGATGTRLRVTRFSTVTSIHTLHRLDFTKVLTNDQVGGDPVTPVFSATPGQEIRVRMLHPGGHPRNDTYLLHAHIWESEPYISDSQALGSNPLSNWVGSQAGVGPGSHFDFLPKGGAGGRFRISGDYLYRTFQSFHFDGGIWGLLRVQPTATPPACTPCPPGQFCPDVVCPVAQ